MLAPQIPSDTLVATLRNGRHFIGALLPNNENERVQEAALGSNERIILELLSESQYFPIYCLYYFAWRARGVYKTHGCRRLGRILSSGC